MRSILLSNSVKKLTEVYPDSVIRELKRIAGLDGKCYTKDDIVYGDGTAFSDVEYVFSTWGMPELTEEEIRHYLPSLKCVFYAAGSVQKFARPFLSCGVKVFSAWAANAVPVAEYTVASIILANKGFYASSRAASIGNRADAKEIFLKYRGNYGVSVGIIGAGMIGKLVIKMLKQYKLDVLVFDPFLPDELANEMGVRKTDLASVFSECDVVSNHLANNDQTKGMLKKEHFASLRPHSTFINTGRGAQVCEDGLIEVLKERTDITAILDVTYPEPPTADSEFYTLENCILTPHIAGSAGDEVHRMAEYMLDEFKSYIVGEECRYEVTREMLATMA